MVEKPAKTPTAKNGRKSQHDQGDPADEAADSSPKPVAVDRPGFDLGGATGKTNAGTGLGLGPDAAENRRDRSLLPERRGKRT